MTNLYAVLLGGKIRKNNLMEDHHLVFAVAENEEAARKIAKTKWDAEDVHVDGTQKLNSIDGYKVILEKTTPEGGQASTEDNCDINPNYSK